MKVRRISVDAHRRHAVWPAIGCVLLAVLIVLAGALQALPARAQTEEMADTPARSTHFGDELSLTGRMKQLIDPTRDMTLADVLQREGDFTALPGNSFNAGYTDEVVWLRLSLKTRIMQHVLLSLTPNFVDFIDVYTAVRKPGLTADDFRHYAMGDHRPLPADDVSGLDNVVPLYLSPTDETLVFIRAASVHSALTLTAVMYSATKHTFRVTVSSLISGLWFGGMATLLAIQLVFYHFDRKPYYILLAFSTLAAMLVYMGNLGVSRLLLFPGGGNGNDYFAGGAVWLGMFASALAGASILELKRNFPLMNRWFQLCAVVGLVGLYCAFFGGFREFSSVGYIFAFSLSTAAMVLSIMSIDSTGTGTQLRAAAYTILWLGLVATVTQRVGIWPLPNWVTHSYAVSCVVQTLLLTGSLAVRLRAAEALNKSMSDQTLFAAQAAERRAKAMVEEKTAELATSKKVAEDALRAELESQRQQVRFMEVISHQYRTPLAVIRTNIDSIGISLPPSDTANHSRLERVRRGIVRLVETLEVNLSRSRLQGSAFSPQLVDIPLGELVDATAARAGDLLPGQITLDIAPDAMTVHVMADAEMLGIAIINLLENAAKYSAMAGGEPVRLSCRAQGAQAIIAVSDKGIGIPPNEIAGILGRSVRGSNARSVEGSGLGLSLVSRIVAAHGGSLGIDSSLTVGTTVTIVLPARVG